MSQHDNPYPPSTPHDLTPGTSGSSSPPPPPSRRRRVTSRAGLLLTLVAAAALAGGGAAWAATRGTGPEVSTAQTNPAQPPQGPPAALGAPGGPRQGWRQNTPFIAGTVTKVSGETVLVTDLQGFQRTIHVSSSTTYTRGGQPATTSALKVGDHVVATGKVDPNKTDLDASSVRIRLPSVAGSVTSVNGPTFQLSSRDGKTHSVTTSSSTVFHQGSSQASLSAVTKGAFVIAEGDLQPNGELAATSVVVAPAGRPGPGFFGEHRGPAGQGGDAGQMPPAPGGTGGAPAAGSATATA